MSKMDYIPHSNSEFNDWQENFMLKVEPNLAAWGVPAESFAALKAKQTAFAAAYQKASNPRGRSLADVLVKDETWESYEKDIRSFVKEWLSNNSKISEGEKALLGLTIKSDDRKAAPVPTDIPSGRVDLSVRLQHSIHIINSSTGTKAKPKGVHGCEIWIKMGGDAPKTADDFTFKAVDTHTPYVITFSEEDLGKTVYYHLRYVNTRGVTGPWSNIISVVIGG